MRRAHGFTLIELLVVLAVIGICVGLASAMWRPDAGAQVKHQAERLAQLLDLASSEARTSGQTLAWTSDGSTYRFWRRADGGWLEILDNALLRARALPGGMTAAVVTVEGQTVDVPVRVEIAPRGMRLAFVIDVVMGTQRSSVFALPTGRNVVHTGARDGTTL